MVRERGFLVLTCMSRLVLGESCCTSIKDFAIFPSHKKSPLACGCRGELRVWQILWRSQNSSSNPEVKHVSRAEAMRVGAPKSRMKSSNARTK